MSPENTQLPPNRIRGFLRGLGEVAEFVREATVAVFEVVTGKWPQPFGARSGEPKAPNQGMGPVKRIAPFPTDD